MSWYPASSARCCFLQDIHHLLPRARYFPLRRSDTVAWAEEAPSPLAALLRGVAAAFHALHMSPQLLAQGLRQVAAVQARTHGL